MTGKFLLMLLSDEVPKCPPISEGWLVGPAIIGCAFIMVVLAVGLKTIGSFILNALDAIEEKARRVRKNDG